MYFRLKILGQTKSMFMPSADLKIGVKNWLCVFEKTEYINEGSNGNPKTVNTHC
jgi:hypothetical protein